MIKPGTHWDHILTDYCDVWLQMIKPRIHRRHIPCVAALLRIVYELARTSYDNITVKSRSGIVRDLTQLRRSMWRWSRRKMWLQQVIPLVWSPVHCLSHHPGLKLRALDWHSLLPDPGSSPGADISMEHRTLVRRLDFYIRICVWV